VIEQLSRVSMLAGAIIGVNSLTGEALYRYGSEEQRRQFLTPLARGDFLTSFAFTEEATGSDPRAIQTKATSVEGGYSITGQKQFVALSPASKLTLVFAGDETKRLSAFLVDTSAAGYQIRHPCPTMGARGLCPAVVYLDGVRVPAANLLGDRGHGFEIMLECIGVGRLAVAAGAVGVGQGAIELSKGYAVEREAHGRPIADMLSIKWLLAEMVSRIEAARLLTYRTAFMRDQGGDITAESATAKLFASQSSVEVTRMAMQVHGAYGYMSDMEIERLYRDAKLTEIYEGVSEIQRVIIADRLLEGNG